ncbi:hypothetical protein V6Z11_A13G122000 [Gossypium hirsutum]|uniref:Uncharacterized protein LOC107893830 isoform X3 n=1 Tax=Gossypium hirsutum TaxID=3635 RepID=A0A1U8IF09_GOSHI|nr:uncharacterized protein LOC107893830 isoform X3 [Gossypium hirsutum]XP_040941032.1 uncharacterized protein LOC107893830 isoform X3 [Gossypium hirsutum]XP_040941033.1 uncharacterized protein LOC107893830 isoform X3 [Gossypium hirsutum]
MDLETENRIAAILLKEAAELKRQADKEGVHVYLQQPKVLSALTVQICIDDRSSRQLSADYFYQLWMILIENFAYQSVWL